MGNKSSRHEFMHQYDIVSGISCIIITTPNPGESYRIDENNPTYTKYVCSGVPPMYYFKTMSPHEGLRLLRHMHNDLIVQSINIERDKLVDRLNALKQQHKNQREIVNAKIQKRADTRFELFNEIYK